LCSVGTEDENVKWNAGLLLFLEERRKKKRGNEILGSLTTRNVLGSHDEERKRVVEN
jgi:hypothetical protein